MILVTGASGFLGRYVTAQLDELEIPWTGTSRSGKVGYLADLTNSMAVNALLHTVRPTRIIHCAARVPKSAPDYGDGMAAAQSLAMTRNLAEYATCPITFASSMTADYATGGYARGKFLAEEFVYRRGVLGDRVIRLPGLFGAPRRSGVLYNAALAFLTDQPFTLDPMTGPWAAMDVRDAAMCMVGGQSPWIVPMDLRAAVSLVAHECGAEWGDPGEHTPAFVLGVRTLVTWVRESVVKATTERTAASCRVSSGALR